MVFLGKSKFWQESGFPTNSQLLSAAYEVGADTVYYNHYNDGVGRKTVKVPVYSDSGRYMRSNSNTYGSFSGTVNQSGSSSYANYSGSYLGGASRDTYISGSTTYAHRQQQFRKHGTAAYFYVHESKVSDKGRLLVAEARARHASLSRTER